MSNSVFIKGIAIIDSCSTNEQAHIARIWLVTAIAGSRLSYYEHEMLANRLESKKRHFRLG